MPPHSLPCAVPSGKPTITAAQNTSSTSLQLSWRPPDPATLHGEFLGYRVAYKPRNAAGSDSVREVMIKDPSVVKYTIQKLEIFTQYLVSLQVYNPEGLGPSTTVVVMTDEGSEFNVTRVLSSFSPLLWTHELLLQHSRVAFFYMADGEFFCFGLSGRVPGCRACRISQAAF